MLASHSSSIAACPSKLTRSRNPTSDATASNNLPALEVIGRIDAGARSCDGASARRVAGCPPSSPASRLCIREMSRSAHPPWLPHRLLSPRQPDVPEVGRRWKPRRSPTKNSPPQIVPSLAVARAVEGHANDASVKLMLGHAACDMGVMVLHSQRTKPSPAARFSA